MYSFNGQNVTLLVENSNDQLLGGLFESYDTIQYVMKNGRLYAGNTADEVYPQKRTLNTSEWKFDKPEMTTTIKE